MLLMSMHFNLHFRTLHFEAHYRCIQIKNGVHCCWVHLAFVQEIIFLVMAARHTLASWLYSPMLKIQNFGEERGVCLSVIAQWTIRTFRAHVHLCNLLSQRCGEWRYSPSSFHDTLMSGWIIDCRGPLTVCGINHLEHKIYWGCCCNEIV